MVVYQNCYTETFIALKDTDAVVCNSLITDDGDHFGVRISNLNITGLTIQDVWALKDPTVKNTLQNDAVFQITNNPHMTTLDLSGIHHIIDTSIDITENYALTTLILGDLIDVTDKKTKENFITIDNNPFLTTIDMGKVETLSYLNFDFCPQVESFALPELTLATNLVLGTADLKPPKIPVGPMSRRRAGPGTQNSRMTTLSLPKLGRVIKNVYIAGHPFLQNLELSNLETVTDLTLGGLVVDDVDLGALSMVHGELDIQETKSEKIEFPALTSAGNLVVQLNPELKMLLFPKLHTVNGDVEINDNMIMTDLDISSLEQTRGDLLLQNLEKLTTCKLSSLRNVGPDSEGNDNYESLLVKNTGLADLELTAIQRVGLIDIHFNTDMSELVIGPKLEKLTNKLFVHQNENLVSVIMQPSERGLLYGVVMNDEVEILANDALRSVSLNNINAIQGNFTVLDNPNLQTIESNVQDIIGPDSYIYIEENPLVMEMEFLYLQKIEGVEGGFVTDLTDKVCVQNAQPAAEFTGINKCDPVPISPPEACPQAITGSGVFGILVAVFLGLAIAGAGGYWYGKRVRDSGSRNGYKSVN